MNFLIFCLATIGATNIIVHGTIFNYPRDLINKYGHSFIQKIISCYECCGFWVGLLFSFLFLYPSELRSMFFWPLITLPIAGAFVGSLLSNFIAVFMNFLESIAVYFMDKK